MWLNEDRLGEDELCCVVVWCVGLSDVKCVGIVLVYLISSVSKL